MWKYWKEKGLNINERFEIAERSGKERREGVTWRAWRLTFTRYSRNISLIHSLRSSVLHGTREVSSSHVGTEAGFFCQVNIHSQSFCSGQLCGGKKRKCFSSLFSSVIISSLSSFSSFFFPPSNVNFFFFECFGSLLIEGYSSSPKSCVHSLFWVPGHQTPR